MLKQKNITVHVISLCVLLIGFVLARYVFLKLHNMYQWPVFLLMVGMFIIVISFFLKTKKLPVFTALAYTVGFWAGVIFQTDGVDVGGAKTNNLWIIWTIVFISFPMVATIVTKTFSVIKREKRDRQTEV